MKMNEDGRKKEIKPKNQGRRTEGPNTGLLTPRNLLIAAAGLVAMVVFVHILGAVLLGFVARREIPSAGPLFPESGPQVTQIPPEPRLQVNPQGDWNSMKANQESLLNSYGWVDQEAGIVRIPIDRAMELTAQRGLPVAPQAGAAEQTETVDDSGFAQSTPGLPSSP